MLTSQQTIIESTKGNGERHVNDEERKALRKKLSELAKRVRVPDPSKADIQAFKDTLPYVSLAFADLARANEQSLAKLATSEHDHALRLTIEYNLDQMRKDLGYNQSSAMERLIIDQVVLSWLRMQVTEHKLTGHTEVRMIEFYDKRANAAQQRFIRACESLAKMRKMMAKTPALQINIANQQVNQINS